MLVLRAGALEELKNSFPVFVDCNITFVILYSAKSGEKLNGPFLIDLTIRDTSPKAVFVRQEVTAAIAKVGQMEKIENLRFLERKQTAYNIAAAQTLREMFSSMVHVTCFSHRLARLGAKVVEEKPVNNLIKNIKNVF